MASKMFSVPGDWSKESKANTEAEVDQNAPVDASAVPRSIAGSVSSSGEVVTSGGSVIGKVNQTGKDATDLAGSAVTDGGDVVSKTGEVLAKADIDAEASDYTTEPVGGEKKTQGGWFDKGRRWYNTASGAYNTASGAYDTANKVAGGASKVAGSLQSNAGEKVPEQAEDVKSEVPQETPNTDAVPEASQAGDAVEGVKDGAQDAAVKPTDGQLDGAPIQMDDKDVTSKTGDVPDATSQAPEISESPAPLNDAKSQVPDAGEATSQVPDVDEAKSQVPDADEAKSQVPDVDEAKSQVPDADEAKSQVPDVDEAKSQAPDVDEAKSQVPDAPEVPEGEKLDETKEGVEGAVDENKETAEGAIDEAKEGAEEATEEAKIDFSILKGTSVNKAGNLVNSNGDVIGRIIEGDKKQLLGKKADADGNIWNDSGKIIGKAEPVPDDERTDTKFAPFENFPDAVVEGDGRVMSEGRQVGTVVEGDAKRLKGSKVDEDGDILDRNGNVVGKAEAWDEPEPEPEPEEEIPDRSILAGKRVNKAGNVVDSNGMIYGRLVEGNPQSLIGRMCDKDGNVRSESGDIIGKAEVIPEGEREGTKDGPFAELQGCTVTKEGKVVTAAGDVVGRLVTGDGKQLFGRAVDEDGDVVDRNGNVLAKAERWSEPEPEPKKAGPLAGRRVNREGNVVDEDGNIIAKLVSGDLAACSGKEIDDDGDVINAKGNTVGHVSLLEDIPPEPTESEEDKKAREQAEADQELAKKLAGSIEQSLDKIRPICKMITDRVDKAERTPKEDLDEEDLVKQVKPLIEEGGKILTETNGMIRGMDPDGRIQRNAKHKSSTNEASPAEHHLADVLKELTSSVTECIDHAKRVIEDMPHAKKELNPLWGLLTEPLGQILAAVGLLLNGVLGLVGRLLSGLGLGGLVDNLLGGLGITRILEGLGLGSVTDSLTGKNDKKKK